MDIVHNVSSAFIIYIEIIVLLIFILLFMLFIHDKYIQRKRGLLINYPVIGRMRYLFEALREPLRQYFADETFYQSKENKNRFQ